MTVEPGKKVYRKKRKHVASKWKPQKDQVLVTQGIHCRSCRTRHGYRDSKALGTSYELRSGTWHILWFCRSTGNVLLDQEMGV